MDMAQSSEHLCYVRCNFCNTVLAVGIPCKRLLDTVTVKCGHCSNLSFLSTKPPIQAPEKKHRLPSAYNRFMKEEIQRIKAANPEIPHREAFSTAAKNWARYIPNSSEGSVSNGSNNVRN
ncbi:hypothetical protein DH2020_032348 [Rehmannia glutinosa]|uniref:YABBY protein C-terminal domain-containing protein n=1 Tax=Rehmannia glutinosa TaxID=99300 RepID=A0ABR0VIJ4_REHGL